MVKRVKLNSDGNGSIRPSDVGYGKPPKAHQFRKGQSGNAQGRPKGKLNLATVVAQAISAKVVVTEGGRRLTKSKLEVSITQMANKAASGDLKAMQMMLNLMPLLNPVGANVASLPDLKADRELAQRLAARLAGQMLNPSKENDHE